MRHLLIDPAFPDILGEAAMQEASDELANACLETACAAEEVDEISKAISIVAAKTNIERIRVVSSAT